jgi:hypothetical protein
VSKRKRDGASDIASRAGHDGDLAGKFFFTHRFSPVVMTNDAHASPPSWPGLSRPSTSLLAEYKDVDAGIKPGMTKYYPRRGFKSIFPSKSFANSASTDFARLSSQPPWRTFSANFSSMSARVSGSCAPPRKCG